MPKRLKELSGLKIGVRHQLIFSAIEKYGLCTILDVLNHVAQAADIDISKKNVQATFKRTIESDLKSFTGVSGKLGVRYFHKDGETEVSLEEIEERNDGAPKNIYVLKYYLLGGKSHVHGANLLKPAGAAFYPQKIGFDNWSIFELDKNKTRGKRIGFIIERGREDLISVSCGKDDIPIEVIIGRSDETDRSFQSNAVTNRQSILCINHKSISRLDGDLSKYQCKITVNKDGKKSIENKGSNHTQICSAVISDIEKLYEYSAKNRTFKANESYPFLKGRSWRDVESEHETDKNIFIKMGEIICYFGDH